MSSCDFGMISSPETERGTLDDVVDRLDGPAAAVVCPLISAVPLTSTVAILLGP
jgi:hypothetical protein